MCAGVPACVRVCRRACDRVCAPASVRGLECEFACAFARGCVHISAFSCVAVFVCA